MKTNTLLIVLMAALVVMAAIQAVQLNVLSQAISGGVTTGAKTSALTQLAQASQVGGC